MKSEFQTFLLLIFTKKNFRKNILESLLQVCYSDYFGKLTYPSLFGNASEYVKILFELGPGFDSTFMHCFWRNNEKVCNETFKYFLTEEGICYTFNSPDQSNIYRNERFVGQNYLQFFSSISSQSLLDELVFDSTYRENVQWSLENGYIDSDYKSTLYPYRAMGSGAKAGLNLYLLDMEINNDMLCRNGQQGFKVIELYKNVYQYLIWMIFCRLFCTHQVKFLGLPSNSSKFLQDRGF